MKYKFHRIRLRKKIWGKLLINAKQGVFVVGIAIPKELDLLFNKIINFESALVSMIVVNAKMNHLRMYEIISELYVLRELVII